MMSFISNYFKSRKVKQEYELQLMLELGQCIRCKGRGTILISPCYSAICKVCGGSGKKK